MIDIFAIADIRYEILSYLDHFTLMRACCCKDWLATARRILSAVTHTDIISFGYMTACPNLVSIKIHHMDDGSVRSKLRECTFPNIRTIEYADCYTYLGVRWRYLLEIFANIENMLVTYNHINGALYEHTIICWLLGYPKIKKLTIRGSSIYVDAPSFDCSVPVTLIRCRIHTCMSLTNVSNLTMLDCTISTW
jgi:hypothetical protein